MTRSAQEEPPPTRRTYVALLLAGTVLAVYGSLVPLRFVPLPLEEALARFQETRWLSLGIASRADLVANLLLFLPLGFLAMASLRTDRAGAAPHALAALGTALALGALSLAIEFTQLFFPARTVSWNDVAAESSGALLGALGWLALGPALTELARDIFAARTRAGLLLRALQAYALGLLLVQLMPLDLTLDPGHLAQKAREGRMNLVPFAFAYPSLEAALWDVCGDVLLHAPIGALALLGWTRPGERRSVLAATALTALAAALVEGAQLFVFSRSSDTGDVLAGALGGLLGALVAARFTPRSAPRDPPSDHAPGHAPGSAQVSQPETVPTNGAPPRFRPALLGATLAWSGVLAALAWWPFDLRFDRPFLKERLSAVLRTPPFAALYAGSDFHAFVEISRKAALAIPLGLLLGLAVPLAARPALERLRLGLRVGLCALVLGVIEAGQLFAPARYPDATDVGIGLLGALVGLWAARRWERAGA